MIAPQFLVLRIEHGWIAHDSMSAEEIEAATVEWRRTGTADRLLSMDIGQWTDLAFDSDCNSRRVFRIK